MRTTVDIDPRTLEEVVKVTGQKSKSKAVNAALEEYLRGVAYDTLFGMAGTIEFDEDRDIWRRTDLGMLREFEVGQHGAGKPSPGR